MQTSLPDLPFPYIDPIYDPKHSTSKSTPRRHPRTDLEHLVPWQSFDNDIHSAIEAVCTARNIPTGTTLSVGNNVTSVPGVNDEEALRAHASLVLHMAARDVLAYLGVIGGFRSSIGSEVIVGDPDFCWVEREHPDLVVCASNISFSILNSICHRSSTSLIGWPTC